MTTPALAQSRLDYVFGSGDSFANGVATQVVARQLQDVGSFLIEIDSIDAGTGLKNERLFKSTVDGFGLVVDHNQTLPGVPDVTIHNYGGQDLFIRYSRADRQGVVLFTAVPEPGSTTFLGLAGLLLVSPRRRAMA